MEIRSTLYGADAWRWPEDDEWHDAISAPVRTAATMGRRRAYCRDGTVGLRYDSLAVPFRPVGFAFRLEKERIEFNTIEL